MAPEIYVLNNFTFTMDIFALGLIFAFVLGGGLHPFDDGGDKESCILKMKGKGQMTFTVHHLLNTNVTVANEIFNLICSMLNYNPEARPTASSMIANEFFNIQQKLLTNKQSTASANDDSSIDGLPLLILSENVSSATAASPS